MAAVARTNPLAGMDQDFLKGAARVARSFLRWVMEEEVVAAADAEKKSMYVSRALLNAEDVIAWAKAQGFVKTITPDDMHVTVAFSRNHVDWSGAGDHFDHLQVSNPEGRSVETLGDKGAIVLRFDAPELAQRWKQFKDIGASWDWPGYKPHVTLTYSGDGAPDLATIKPYDGVLKFGPEKFAEVDEDWAQKVKEIANDMALDRNTVRSYDADGRLHVKLTNISKAAVNEYLGSEIPDFEALGLEPTKRYRLLRDPEELAKAAPSFNNIQLLFKHIPISADDPQRDIVVGTTGSDAVFNAPYLQNSLAVWVREGIAAVESDEQKELSSAYRYRADMTPGEYRGEKYDGVMRDIKGNHVALVREGRAGPDVVVGDEALPTNLENTEMSKSVLTRKAAVAKGAILAFLQPKLAADAKIDVTPLLAGVTHQNFKDKKAGIILGLKERTKDKLAKDASLDDVTQLLDALEQAEEVESADSDLTDVTDLKTMDADTPKAKLLAFLKGKISDEDCATAASMFGQDEESEEDRKKREEAEKVKAQDKEPEVTKAAMDAAISKAVKTAEENAIKNQREIRDAERAVRPYVGELAMAHDSAEAVYRTALGAMGVKIEGIHASALPAILEMQPLPGAVQKRRELAMDESSAKSFNELFPGASRIGTL